MARQLQDYFFSTSGDRLGPIAVAALTLTAIAFVGGIWWTVRPAPDALQMQVRGRVGAGIACWAVAETALLLWRLLGFGDWRILPYFGMLVGLGLFSYAVWYILYLSPHDRQTFATLKERYESDTAHKGMRGGRKSERLSPGLAQVGAFGGAGLFYFAMFPSQDHALHWTALLIGGVLGYGVALVGTARQGISSLAWHAAQRKKRPPTRRR